jgi:2-polyprenyl-3-methyl-5-hydroxy-6-metoxy-1,4-benzoquinol methylase
MFHVKHEYKMREIILNCPVCGNNIFNPFLKVKDHFLSQEEFSIQECDSCSFRFVNPRPGKSDIGRYYQSDKYISHDAEKSDLLSRLYKLARIISIRGKFRIVKKFCMGGKILDIGCGTGEFLNYCRIKGFEVAGVEPNDKARAYAQSKNLIIACKQLELLSGMNGMINCITMWHVLEHIHDLNELIMLIKQLLAPNGVLIVAVPNSNSWDAAYYKHFWAAYDIPRHIYHFTKGTMQGLASRTGLEVRKIFPQKLDAYYVSMLSEKYQSGKTNYFKSIAHGFWSNWQAKKHDTGHSSLIFVLSLKNA